MRKEFSKEELEEIAVNIGELIMNEQLVVWANFEGTIGSCIAPTIKENSPSINGNVIEIYMMDQVAVLIEHRKR